MCFLKALRTRPVVFISFTFRLYGTHPFVGVLSKWYQVHLNEKQTETCPLQNYFSTPWLILWYILLS